MGTAARRVALIVALAASAGGCGRLSYDRLAEGDGGPAATIDSAPVPDAMPDPDLLVDIGFDGDPELATVDERGLLADGSCTPVSRCPTTTAGLVGGAYLFDGVDDYIQFDTSSLLDFGDQGQPFSVALWYRADDLTPPTQRVLMAQATAGGSVAYQLSFEPWQDGPEQDLVWKVCESDCQSGLFAVAADLAIVDEWILAVGTWDGTTTRLFIDAQQIAARDKSTITFDGSPLMIGADLEAAGIEDTFAGAIDELRIYTRVLSVAEQQDMLSVRP